MAKEPQPPLQDPDVHNGVGRKLEKVTHRRYMARSGIDLKSLIKSFTIPKEENNIHIVYDAIANKLYECVWVPSFWLPTRFFALSIGQTVVDGGPRHC